MAGSWRERGSGQDEPLDDVRYFDLGEFAILAAGKTDPRRYRMPFSCMAPCWLDERTRPWGIHPTFLVIITKLRFNAEEHIFPYDSD
jgi:hypothetical protein